jgi:hypothetical protein
MLPFNLNEERSRFPFEETLASGRYRSRFRNRAVARSAGPIILIRRVVRSLRGLAIAESQP